jgi:hypothetical protein
MTVCNQTVNENVTAICTQHASTCKIIFTYCPLFQTLFHVPLLAPLCTVFLLACIYLASGRLKPETDKTTNFEQIIGTNLSNG